MKKILSKGVVIENIIDFVFREGTFPWGPTASLFSWSKTNRTVGRRAKREHADVPV